MNLYRGLEEEMADKTNRTEKRKQTPIQFYIDEELKQRLRKYCFDKETKNSIVLRSALSAFLDKQGY